MTRFQVYLQDANQYRRLVGKFLYLTITRLDVNYVVQLLSQFLQNPTSEHMKATLNVLRYLKSAPGQGILMAYASTAQLTTFVTLTRLALQTRGDLLQAIVFFLAGDLSLGNQKS